MAVRIQLRNDTAANWTDADPVLGVGELGLETDTVQFKIGDGVSSWTELEYGISGPTGPIGPSGGPTGPQGIAATIAVGTVSSTGPNGTATVTNSGTSSSAIFDFVLKQGVTGPSGVISVTGPITNTGTSTAAVIGLDETGFASLKDNLIRLDYDQVGNSVDLGLVVRYGDGTNGDQYSGIVRDVSDDRWRLFKDVDFTPTTTVNFPSGILDDLQLKDLYASNAEFSSNISATGTVTGKPAEPDINANTAKNLGYVGMPQVILNTGNLTLSKAHAGEHIYVTGASQTITIPANASVPLEIGTTIIVINANVTSSIAITTDTLRLAGTATTGTRTLAANGMATLVKIAATTWIASGVGLT
jgi:hypothetical protein